jgi:hypothetical protein
VSPSADARADWGWAMSVSEVGEDDVDDQADVVLRCRGGRRPGEVATRERWAVAWCMRSTKKG